MNHTVHPQPFDGRTLGRKESPCFVLGGRPAWDLLGFLGEKNPFKTISFLKVCPYERTVPYGGTRLGGQTDPSKAG